MVCINQGFNGTVLELGFRKGRIETYCFQNSWQNKNKTNKQTTTKNEPHQNTNQPSCQKVLSVLTLLVMYLRQLSLRLTDVGYYLSRIYLRLPKWTWKTRRRRLEMVENCEILPLGNRGSLCALSKLWVTPEMKNVSLLTWQLISDFLFCQSLSFCDNITLSSSLKFALCCSIAVWQRMDKSHCPYAMAWFLPSV